MAPKSNTPEPNPMQKLQDFTRRVLSVPKKEIDQKLAAEKATKKKRH
jgi:hypothetical protein